MYKVKKILYFSRYYINKKFSLKSKFDNQIQALKKLGYDVWYIGCDNHGIYLLNNKQKIKLMSIYGMFIPKYKNTILHIRLSQAVEYAVNNYKFDYIYMRQTFATPYSISMIKTIKKNDIKVIMEIPTYSKNESKEEKRIFRRIFLKLTNKLNRYFYKYIDLFTIIGDKVQGLYYGKPAINILNGFDVSSVPKCKNIVNEDIHMLGIANMAYWHGYDRIIEGLRNYRNKSNEKVVIHLIGPNGDGSLDKWKKLVDEYDLNEFIKFEGPKYGDELNYYFNKCELAIGSLGRHRSGHKYLCTLKVREYMARGIPFIISHTDLGLDSNKEYYLKVPGNEEPINIEKLIDFVKSSRKNNGLSQKMRKYAKKNMSWEKQFKKVFSYLK
jgi:glycosyltransferase involved in cell wall biosynthesis